MELLENLARWTRTPRPCGAELRCDDRRIVIRVGAPIVGLDELVVRELRRPVVAARRFVTLEGEPAAIAHTDNGACAIAIGDRDATHVIGFGSELAELVKQVAQHTFMGASELRRRRFVYRPPAHWHSIARPYAARFLHPEFPRCAHAVVVHHARPHVDTDLEIADRLLVTDPVHGVAISAPTALAEASSQHGLTGTFARIDLAAEPRSIVRATLRDSRFAYVAELFGPTATIGAELATLHQLVTSIEPVPAATFTALAERFIYWGD